MPDEIIQGARWPGVEAVESCSGSVGHGTSPSVFTLVTYPQAAEPLESGDLVFFDGENEVTLKDCKVDAVAGRAGSDGQTWTLTILDRRWKWRGGRISGRYNQLDPRGKLIPWTIRSPEELALLCLKAAGETRFLLDLPDGLEKATGADEDKYLRLGENFAESFSNPPVVWDQTPPIEALARLAEQLGRRFVYQPVADRILVTPLGSGKPLPDGPCEVIAPSINSPETPQYVAIAGAPVRIQCRLLLEPVGREWDGEWLPIDLLSYAPQATPQVQISTGTYTGAGNPDALYVSMKVNAGQPNETDVTFRASSGTVAQKLSRLRQDINAHADVKKIVTASETATVLTLTGKKEGEAFWGELTAINIAAGNTWIGNVTQIAIGPGGKTWRTCRPPNFGSVRATDRLQRSEALALAQSSVFRSFRILAVDPHTGQGPLKLPWYRGEIKRRQQLILQPTKVDQLRPLPRDKEGRDKGTVPLDPRKDPAFATVLGGILPPFYNGYSRDQPATVYGSVSARIGSVLWNNALLNTEATSKVYVPFSIDPLEQIVTFAEPIYREWPVAGTMFMIEKPTLTLETAVLVLDAETHSVVRWDKELLELGGSGLPEWQVREDVYVGVIGNYDDKNRIKNFDQEGIDDAKGRAAYYLDGMAAKYRLVGGEMRSYIGIIPHDPDGYTQMVGWSIGPGGATTMVSANTEFDPWVPAYPQRRLKENLPPDKSAAQANLLEQRFIDRILPPVPGKPGT